MNPTSARSRFFVLGLIACTLFLTSRADAGGRRARRGRLVPTSAPRVADVAPSPMLGTFYPTPIANIRGNYASGGGYSPLDLYGDSTMALYGPFSPFRELSAPVQVYQRGYDGSYRVETGIGTSTPNLPAASRVIYPWRANVLNAPRRVSTPPEWESGINFIDLN